MNPGASKAVLKAKAEDTHHPHLAYPLQSRPAPGRPSADRIQGVKIGRRYGVNIQRRLTVRLIPIGGYHITTDLMTLCLVPRDNVVTAIEMTKRYQQETRQACHQMFHWYGSVVNINPALFNFVVAAYERLRDRGVPLSGEAVEEFEASYVYEAENNLSHVVSGRLATSAGSIDKLLTEIMNSTRF